MELLRILVFSDSHHDADICAGVINNIVGVDMVLHAGDHLKDAELLEKQFPDIPIRYVCGNCDFEGFPKELVLDADGKKIFLTHGHLYGVKCGISALLSRAKELDCDCAVFGHTHSGFCDVMSGITLLNPGSIRYGRTFGVIEIENGTLRAAVCDA